MCLWPAAAKGLCNGLTGTTLRPRIFAPLLPYHEKEINMIKDSYKKITILCLVLAMLFAVTACDSDPASDGSDIQTMNVTLTILYPRQAATDSVQDSQPGQAAERQKDSQTQESKANDEKQEGSPNGSQAQSDKTAPENLENYPLQVEEKATVMQILEAYSNQEGVRIQVSSAEPHRVTAINGIAETKAFGWTYEINGKAGDPGDAAARELENGDHITWKYEELQ